ncbi:MAG: hypothetical protein R6W82_00415, partial [bacterium]
EERAGRLTQDAFVQAWEKLTRSFLVTAHPQAEGEDPVRVQTIEGLEGLHAAALCIFHQSGGIGLLPSLRRVRWLS